MISTVKTFSFFFFSEKDCWLLCLEWNHKLISYQSPRIHQAAVTFGHCIEFGHCFGFELSIQEERVICLITDCLSRTDTIDWLVYRKQTIEMSRFCSRGARLQKVSSHRVIRDVMQHVVPDRMCAYSLKWSGRLSHRVRRSWSVSFPAKSKHLWEVLLIFNPLRITSSFIIGFFFYFSLNLLFELK